MIGQKRAQLEADLEKLNEFTQDQPSRVTLPNTKLPQNLSSDGRVAAKGVFTINKIHTETSNEFLNQ